MKMHFTLKKLVLALTIAGSSVSMAWAGSTPTTASVQGSAPVLSAPSNSVAQAVDLGSNAAGARLSSGDTITLTYGYNDADGDADDSTAHVSWYYVSGSTETQMTVGIKNTPATGGAPGTSELTLPTAAIGADRIKVVIQEYSATGSPISGNTITVEDTSTGGGGTVTPPGPIAPGGHVAGGIFLQTESPTAGSGATDYARTTGAHPQVGATYVFRAWDDSNANGVWDSGEADLTTTLGSIQWHLDGINTAASGNSSAVTLSNHAISGATTDTYTVPINSASTSGATSGDQGFSLKVDFN
ncbi:SinI family autotransporter-associated protein [Yersinia enterocolitica]|uniref:SinI family autotransporter-associated protein n=1 Tax=Yersinia enterocolitica TaxID=630 RepID=UPI001C8DC767|nr:SinI family autotransporter-associated protein [Yersinia enterocolitica]EKN4180490.1 ornithine carbamoyltransferase [Yersinia enterocolitica]MBX9487372.1 ornithine carbamoyltransferase [Yersinia enterocolitica]MBX9490716.1 ornithine carbamoyltransferase [Yersinia enterocolitica]